MIDKEAIAGKEMGTTNALPCLLLSEGKLTLILEKGNDHSVPASNCLVIGLTPEGGESMTIRRICPPSRLVFCWNDKQPQW